MRDSELVVNAQGRVMVYSGPDATNLFRARLLASSLRMYASCGLIPTRGVTATRMLAMAKGYTGKTYKRGQYVQAADDIDTWARTMVAALPIVEEGERTPK